MKKIVNLFFISLIFLFWGCAQSRYTQIDVGQIEVMYKGTVTSAKTVNISDSGEGAILGAIVGGILGHQIGKGKGKDLATVAGAVGGAVVGNQLNKNIGQELIIDLDNGKTIKTVIRIDNKNHYFFRSSDRVIVYLKGNKIVKITPIFNESIE